MSWTLYRWVWQLCSPLHIGITPSGSLNRTRLYIPARNMWAALTAEIARCRSGTSFPDYQNVGQELQDHVRLSYLFPAEKVDDQWCAWLPQYRKAGLFWHREHGGIPPLAHRSFRQRLLTTRPGTAIEPVSDSAEEGTLREFELISPWWHCSKEKNVPVSVAMVGYLLCKGNDSKGNDICKKLLSIKKIYVGGDTRYGLGYLQRVDKADNLQLEGQFFGNTFESSNEIPIVQTNRVLAHVVAQGVSLLSGNMECISGWDMISGGMKSPLLTWKPGSGSDQECKFVIQEDGTWKAT